MRRPTFTRTAAAATGLAVVAAASALHSSHPSAAHAAAAQGLDPAHFGHEITNPYLPYRPGSVWVYSGIKDGVSQRDVVRATDRTRTILGIHATVVTDVATHDGRVLERTTDWYAQDDRGNVWYLGEQTADYTGGTVDTSGSWQAGVKGARAGIVMTAHPAIGDTHRQEYWRGHAEDQYWLVDLGQRVTVPAGTFTHAALTLEWSRLEPNVIDRKDYVRGIGVVREQAAQGPAEVAGLVRFVHP